MRKLLILLLCLSVHGMARGQTNIYEYRYWFDDQSEAVVSGHFDAPGGHIDVLTDGLDDNPHVLHLQLKDTAGVWSSPINRLFQKQTIDPSGTFSYHIWANEDTERMNTGTLNGDTLHLDMSHLPDGLQQFYVQVSQGDNYSVPIRKTFIKIPHAEGMGYIFCMMNIDGTPYRLERLPMSGGAATWVIDTDSLSTGIHRYTIMAITPTGYTTSIREGFFVRENMASQLANQRCCYQVDGGEAVVVDGQVSGDKYHFDLDMSGLSNGLHKLIYWMVSDNGATTEIHTALFVKIPMGGTGVKEYDYWLNDNFDNRHTTTLSKVQDPFQLISLLPMETVPLQSSNFKFAFKGEQPVIYAQNDFHVRFLDAGDRYVETTKKIVDEKVWEDVVPVAEIQPTQTFDRVEENGIRWYTLEAQIGDTVSFKCDKACTLQLFSPSGEEVYTASGVKSVNFDGCHTRENGTYYLAVHDMTGSGPTQTLDYQHLDKYAVVSYTPHVVGNVVGNHFTMHLVGNGFDKLSQAFITQTDGLYLTGTIDHITSSEAFINFMIDSLEYANDAHDLILYYLDEDKTDSLVMEKALLFEEADYGKILVSKTGGPSITSPFTVSIKVTNSGNMSYSYIPFNIAWDKPHQVRNVEFKNFYASVAAELDSLGYSLVSVTDNLLNKGVEGAMMFFYIPHLNPHETKEFQLNIQSTTGQLFNLYAWTGTPVELDSIKVNQLSHINQRKAHTNDSYPSGGGGGGAWPYSNRGQNMINFSDAVGNVTGVPGMPNVVSVAGSTANVAIKTGVAIGDFINATGRRIGDEYINAYGLSGDDADFIRDAYRNQYPEVNTPGSIVGGPLGKLLDWLSGNQDDCAHNPTPHPGDPHNTGTRISVDPNEIYGTTSPSGSIYINDSLRTVNYRIQFENDSVFATAAAQTVIVSDTLDTRYLDLSTFSPTFVKIADDMYEVDGNPNFVKTIDMRPRINTIVQVNCDLDKQKGIATWTFRSLDPMTMEPVTDIERGFLPVNYGGISGIGEVAFDIDLKQPLPNGTEISNRSGNIFDSNEPVMTPYWTNIIDAVAPTSSITSYEIVNDSTMTLHFDGTDNLSGVWKYDVYVCYGENAAPFKCCEDVTGNECDVRIYQGLNHGFFVVATDSACNVEQKNVPEIIVPIGYKPGDVNHDGTVNVTDVMLVVNNIIGYTTATYFENEADIDKNHLVNITDVMNIVNIIVFSPSDAPHNARMATGDYLRVETKGKRSTLHLVGSEHYTGCQMLVQLPEDCSLKNTKLNSQCGSGYSMNYRDLGNGLYKMVVYSQDGRELPEGDVPLIDLDLDGKHANKMAVTNIQLTNRHFENVVMADVGIDATGVGTIHAKGKEGKTYNTQGIEVNTPTKGVYIQSGKKVVRP